MPHSPIDHNKYIIRFRINIALLSFILNLIELKILTDDFSGVQAYLKRAYIVSSSNEEKLLTVFMDYIIKSIQNQNNKQIEKALSRHMKKKLLIQTNLDSLYQYLEKKEGLEKSLKYIKILQKPEINLFYRNLRK